MGGQVRKGEHGALIIKYGRHERRVKGREDEEPKATFHLRAYTVFNALQIDGIRIPETKAESVAKTTIEAAEAILESMPSKPTIHEGKRVKACYHINTDTVDMPERNRFESVGKFYSTLFHELIHATGHETRLNRKSLMGGSASAMEEYSKEELVAEMGAAFLSLEAGIVEGDHADSAGYIQCWLATLREPQNKRWIIDASSQAAKAANFVLARE
jgi:antirestriction protein ArdC